MLNCAAVSLKQRLWAGAELFCTRALAFKELLRPATKAKTLYRRAIARRLPSREGKYLCKALSDIKEAHELQPGSVEIAAELATIQHMLTLQFTELKRVIERQRRELPPVKSEFIFAGEDAQVTSTEARVRCTRSHPPSFDYRTAPVPEF
ncbi:hypothetical protein FIBSPDRAFT_1047143 [Athelia psychrophila]|uniref:TPR-like protein n=1 Tax=Athelia psychrophila TaxID=1759441 RepID=A0A166FPZ4_9AGAM|nr:hypothetical protein FIBSPDRAFT_1047143 [Fibularhizoctonia sp. CBS 109695]